MIPWWVALIAWVAGEIMAFATIIICMGGDSTEEDETDWAEEHGLIYPRNKKDR